MLSFKLVLFLIFFLLMCTFLMLHKAQQQQQQLLLQTSALPLPGCCLQNTPSGHHRKILAAVLTACILCATGRVIFEMNLPPDITNHLPALEDLHKATRECSKAHSSYFIWQNCFSLLERGDLYRTFSSACSSVGAVEQHTSPTFNFSLLTTSLRKGYFKAFSPGIKLYLTG